MILKIPLLFTFILFSSSLSAQNISGIIRNEEGKAIHAASVSLRLASDSLVIKYAVTNKAGEYSFLQIDDGSYFISATVAEFSPANSPVFKVKPGTVRVGTLTLQKLPAKLGEVIVQANKPMIEVKADRTILHVEESINSIGQNALELLRKSPGVLLDGEDNISMNGKNGVQIYIDGKTTPLSGTDLADYLKGIQSSQIETIELITNPSAKYEAAGNAGIINIRLKKNKYFGTNGSINAGYAIGRAPKYNAGFSLNFKNKRINFFSTYNYSWNNYAYDLFQYRRQLDTVYSQPTTIKNTVRANGFKVGFDYLLNQKSTIGVMVNGNSSNMDIDIHSIINILYGPANTTLKFLHADNRSQNIKFNTNYNLNYRFADTLGHQLNIDADYGRYRLRTDQFQPNIYFDKDNLFLYSMIYKMVSPSNIDIYSGKADYDQGWMGGNLGAGVKVSYVKSYNNFNRYNVYGYSNELDNLRSNNFLYEENINAGYVNYNRHIKGFLFQAGLRIENSNIKGISTGYRSFNGGLISYDSVFNRHYTDFFPSASVTYNKNPKMVWGLSYSRRIDRPVYQDLNPFEFKVDEYSFKKGNTNLRPQYTHNISLSNTYKNKLTTVLSYSHINDVISQLVDTIDGSKGFITRKNLANQDIINLNIGYPVNYKWYTASVYLNGYYSKYTANFGPGRVINLSVFAVNATTQQRASLGKGYSIELSGFYSSPSIWNGTFRSRELWSVSSGVQKTLWKNKATFRLSVNDIFKSMKIAATSNFAGQFVRFNAYAESRQFKINFTYRFGSNYIKTGGQRKTGVEELSERVGSQGSNDNNVGN